MGKLLRIAERFEINDLDAPTNLIGRGGMGTVYRGIDLQTGEIVAIKVLKPDIIQRDPDMLERFRREGEALRQLNHPNIVKMLGTADVENNHYLIMEYVRGGSLRDVLDEQRQFSVQRALYTALDIADALTRAHRLKILHRDIKPGNVLMADDGTPRLTDFGMAHFGNDPNITAEGAIVGTLAYLPPEAFNGDEPDERTDIWSFGVMLYEMLAGERPFQHEQPGALINAIMTQPPPDLDMLRTDIPVALLDLIYRMLNKDKTARVPSVRMVGAELEMLLRGGDTSVKVAVTDSDARFALRTPTPTPQTGVIHTPNNLPAHSTPFVGRDRELGELATLLNSDDVRLVTILAPGGMGKTRIAIETAQQQLSSFADGVFFVPLAPLDDANHVVATIAEHIGFEFSGGGDPQDELLQYLHEKNILLVLDNFEHVMAAAKVVAQILQSSAQTKVLVTSRERLRLSGENTYDLSGMILPDAENETPVALEAYPAVKLFLQSARRAMPEFVLDDENAHHVAAITRLVQGLPLGIELAAGWLGMLPIDEITSEIQNSFDFLETDLVDVPERHRSIRAVFDYSWNLLSVDEQKAFMRLSIFRGGFERDAAQRVAEASLRTLTTFVNKSLLRRNPDGRYFLHQLLRDYAHDQFTQQAEKPDVYRKYASYYADFISKLAPVFNTEHELDALEALEREIENIRTAWHVGIKLQHWQAFDAILHPIALFYLGRSMLQEGREAFCTLAEAMEKAGATDTMTYWRARVRQIWIGVRIGQYDEGLTLGTKAIDYFMAHENHAEASYAYNALSYVYMGQGQYDKALEYGAKAAELTQDFEAHPQAIDAWFMAMGNMGYAYYLMGDYKNARVMYETLNTMPPSIKYSPSGMAYGKNNLGEILRDIGETETAFGLFGEAYEVFKKQRHKRGMAFTLNNLGGVCFLQGMYDIAEKKYREAYALNKDIGDMSGIGHSLSALGNLTVAQGDLEKAKQYYQQSLEIRQQLGDPRAMADSMSDLAQIALGMGQAQEAVRLLTQVLQKRRDIGDRYGEAMALAFLSLAHMNNGNDDEAGRLIDIVVNMADELDSSVIYIEATIGKAERALLQRDYRQAEQYFLEGLGMAFEADIVPLQLYGLVGYATIKERQGDYQQALDMISVVMQHPRSFVLMSAQRAEDLMKRLSANVTQEQIDESITMSRSLVLRQVVAAVLKETTPE